MTDCQLSDILVVTTTVGTPADATRLAQALVEARLAACVQQDAIVSTYRWNGELVTEPEVRLTIKSTTPARGAIDAFLREHHPYDVPQVVAWRAASSPSYAAWVKGEVAAGLRDSPADPA